MAIRFYTNQGFPELSNYFVVNVVYNGLRYPSSEHAFQAAKFLYEGASDNSIKYAETIRESGTPNKARILACQKMSGGYRWRTDLNPLIEQSIKAGVKMRQDWDHVREMVMKDILLCKFQQDLHCQQVLLSTGDRHLIEHTPRDCFWGNGGDDTGANRLGILLMEVRQLLRKE